MRRGGEDTGRAFIVLSLGGLGIGFWQNNEGQNNGRARGAMGIEDGFAMMYFQGMTHAKAQSVGIGMWRGGVGGVSRPYRALGVGGAAGAGICEQRRDKDIGR